MTPDPHHYYLDSNFFIAALEQGDDGCASMLQAACTGAVLATTSALTLAEVLTRPLAAAQVPQNRSLIARYDALFEGGSLQIWPVDKPVLRAAAAASAGGAMALPDSIHVASAMVAGCDVFVSDDRHLRLPGEMTHIRLAALPAFTLQARRPL
ncbi:MAG: PIN domain-containing protein [Hyphomicrobiales bacterium]|nr:PIN domain-containing protein [Hyphomicrobiales bacterium]MDE2113582.1 type II toxin-antitoxin system VapC family toxin [Hyphomicrobiales bacterium]